MELCRQETQIAAIHETLKELKNVLIQIAEQGVAIKAQYETSARHEKAFEILFPRVTALEVKAEGEKVRIGFIVTFMSLACSAVTGLIIKLFK